MYTISPYFTSSTKLFFTNHHNILYLNLICTTKPYCKLYRLKSQFNAPPIYLYPF
nr:MAG TPA: hypothetical protein [Caudoviricetes sp.]